ncbi:putative carboxy-cis,cis-muconate cyclase, partial [Glonium stellatum]
HHLFVGTFNTTALYTLEFNDETHTLNTIFNNTATAPHQWITLDHEKRNLYATWSTARSFSSYSVLNNYTLKYDVSIDVDGNCTHTNTSYILANPEPPYVVYGTEFPGPSSCGSVFSVDTNGVLSDVIEDYSYSEESGVHGLALSPNGRFLYSADLSGNAIWTHDVDVTGEVDFLYRQSMPVSGAGPRHLAVHPSGYHLYAVLEEANELAAYTLTDATGIPAYNLSYPIIPTGKLQNHLFETISTWVTVSSSGSYLWANSRARSSNATGYLTAFSLDPSSGAIIEQILMVPTSSVGGSANSVAAAFFSDQFVALTDYPTGYVEIWQMNNAASKFTAKPIARVDIKDGGCCANAVWYD